MGTLTTLAVSPLDGQVLWAGSDDGRVHVSTSGGSLWTNVSAGLPERWITSVRGDPFDRETAYVTVSGFRWHEPLPHVLRTDNLGQTWTPIAGNLPEAPVNDLRPHPEQPGRLFAATDLGVYETSNGGATWQRAGTGLPNVVVTHLGWDASRQQVVAGTYGRSVWALDAATSPRPSATRSRSPAWERSARRSPIPRAAAPPSAGTSRAAATSPWTCSP